MVFAKIASTSLSMVNMSGSMAFAMSLVYKSHEIRHGGPGANTYEGVLLS
jgi:hypothetical protein